MRGEKNYKFFQKVDQSRQKCPTREWGEEKINFFFKSGPNAILFSNRWWEKFFEIFFGKYPPICHSNLRITKTENFFGKWVPKSTFNSPYSERRKISLCSFSDFRHLELHFSNRWCKEKYFLFFSSFALQIFQLGGERRKNHKFSRFGGKTALNFPTGEWRHPTTKKGGTPMNTTLTTKTKGGRFDARFYVGAESNANMVSLALGTG